MTRTFVLMMVVGCFLGLVSLAAQAATPKEAVGFIGVVTGVVKTTAVDGTSFVLTVSKATADEKNSKITDTAAMVGKDLTLGTRMPKTDGKPNPHPDDIAYIKTLKAGDAIVVDVFAVRSDPTILRIQKPGKSVSK